MSTTHRHKNATWVFPETPNYEAVAICVQMDIRDALLEIIGLLRCHRIPKALDALHSLGVAARRRKRRRK